MKTTKQNPKNRLGSFARLLVCASLALLVLAQAPAPVAASTDRSADCNDALNRVHDYLQAHQTEMDIGQGMAYLYANANDACHFDQQNADAAPSAPANPTDLKADVQHAWTTLQQKDSQFACNADCVDGLTQKESSSTQKQVVACQLPGAGPGSITGSILGVQLVDSPAAGQWYPPSTGSSSGGDPGPMITGTSGSGGDITVTGDGAILGGTQTGSAGVMRLAHVVGIPDLDGSSSATCLKTTTVTEDTQQECTTVWVLIVYYHNCKTHVTVKTDIQLDPCTGSATQTLLGVVTLQHAYAEDPDPCQGVGASFFGGGDGTVYDGDPTQAFDTSGQLPGLGPSAN
jgi:hypothetical protein